MRPSVLLVFALAATSNASWFGSDKPVYNDWDSTQLKAWLIEHNLYTPSLKNAPPSTLKALVQANYDTASSWTEDQYNQAQKTFENVKEDAFGTWDESRLRDWLVKQGVVSPSGPKEELVLLAQSKYAAYTNAASSLAAQASATASSAVYGDPAYQASKSLASVAAEATTQTTKALNDSKDYIYSTWDDNRLRAYLEEKGVLKTKTEKTRDELLAMMSNAYATVADPVWDAWSDSYIREWLVEHGVLSPHTNPSTMTRADLQKHMNNYYYSTSDYVWSTWSDSDLKDWLVTNGYIKSDAQVKREKMQKMVSDTYSQATSTLLSSYSDSALRNWLIDHGYLRSDAQVKRDELVATVSKHYSDAVAKGDKFFTDAQNSVRGNYLTWPDARLRAYLRQRGLSEEAIPTTRPGLLQEVRIRWVQTTSTAESMYLRIREVINNGVGAVEEKLSQVLHILTGTKEEAKAKGQKGYHDAKAKVKEGEYEAKKQAKVKGEKLKGEL